MKRFLFLFAVLVAAVILPACDCLDPFGPEDESSQVLNWGYFRGSAYLGDLSSYDPELQDAIKEFFPLSTSMASAQVVFVDEADVKAKSPELLKAIANDAFVVFPDYPGVKEDFAAMGVDLDIAEVADEDYKPLLYCYNGFGQGFTYTMFGQTEFEDPDPIDNWTDEEWQALVEASEKLGPEIDDGGEAYEWDYYESLVSTFVYWLYNELFELTQTKSLYAVGMKWELEDMGKRYTCSYSVNLNKTIDKDFKLNRSTTINVDIRLFPVYKLSANGDQAGDYYIVVSKIIPYNQNMWDPHNWEYNWACRLRAYGYWFEEMNVATSLVRRDGGDIKGLNYYDTPIPENKNVSKQYSEGKSFNIGGTLNGGIGDVAGNTAGLGLTIGGGWSSSTSYELSTIDFTLDSSTPTVKYRYYTNEKNVKLTDDWGEDGKINNNFPTTVRNQFNANTSWVWHVPSVKDNETTAFKLKNKMDITYATWYHWRAAIEYDSNKKTYKTSFPEFSWNVVAPDRVPWGILALKNASTYEMSHVTVYDSNNKKVDVLSSSFSKDQVAKVALPEGSYSVTFDLIDGTSQMKYGSYVYKDVTVKSGTDEKSSTVEISTIDAVKQ